MLSNGTGMYLHNRVEGSETKILQIGVCILNKGSQLLDAELHRRQMRRKTRNTRLDTFIKQRHCRGSSHKVVHGLHQKTRQTRLQRSEDPKELDNLDQHPVVRNRRAQKLKEH